ncbi:MAG: icmO [Deltaproteobacteria bacterium]|nr:icmO [Deltaproteobacteria bacterium]
MSRSINDRAERARIAPASRLSPRTWLVIRWVNPFVMTICSAATAFISPLLALSLTIAGIVVQCMASDNSPRPAFTRNPGDKAIFLGKDEYGIPVHLPVSEITRHGMLLGTTGSGKTTAIRSIADSVMRMGGGFCFIDGKSDVTDTYEVLYEIVEDCDRIEDLLVLNFLNPAQSHTFNFMTYGDADFLAEIMTGFLKQADGDQVYWQERGKILMKALLTQLVYKRDNPDIFGEYVLTPSEVRKHLSFDSVIALEADERYPLYHDGVPVKARLRALLSDLPGWEEYRNKGQGGRMSPAAGEALRQYGFFVQQWGTALDLLAGTFNRIFDTDAPEIDMVDVVSNSRILVVLLPSLSYSLSTLQALGRLTLNAFKIALTSALGTRVEGDYEEIRCEVERRRPQVPFTLIADEYGSYAVEGFDTVLAQGRSLGFGVIISVQELASLFKASETDAKRLIGNTNYKIVMKIEDTETAKFLGERAGESFFMMPNIRSEGKLVENLGNWDGTYAFQRGSRVDMRDLASLKTGEGYLFTGDDVRRFKTRFIPPRGNVRELRLMKYAKREMPGPAHAKKPISNPAMEDAQITKSTS